MHVFRTDHLGVRNLAGTCLSDLFPQQLLTPVALHRDVGTWEISPNPCRHVSWCCANNHTAREFTVQVLCRVWKTLSCHKNPHPLALTTFPPSSTVFLGCAVDVPITHQYRTVPYSLQFDQLWISVVASVRCKRSSLDEVRAVLTYVSKNKTLHRNKLKQLRKMAVIGFLQGPMTPPAPG